MNAINVSICARNNCFKKQATLLKSFDQLLSPAVKMRVNLICSQCEKVCTSDCAYAPRVKINNRMLNRATPAQVRKAVLALT